MKNNTLNGIRMIRYIKMKSHEILIGQLSWIANQSSPDITLLYLN